MSQHEFALLSVMMKSPETAYAVVADGITESSFDDLESRRIFLAIIACAGDLKDTSIPAIIAHPSGKGIPVSRLLEIENIQPTTAHTARIAQSVLDSARLRRLLSAAKDIGLAASDQFSTWPDAWAQIAPLIETAQLSASSRQARSLASFCNAAVLAITQPDTRKAISTGIPSLDAAFTVLRAGEMVTLAARPGTGKSALAIQIAIAVAKTGQRTVFFSLEMSGEELAMRLGLIEAGRPALMDDKFLVAGINKMSGVKTLHIFDNSERYTIDDIEARCRLIEMQSDGLGIVVIDYLQLVRPADTRAPREQQVAAISRRIKEMAGVLKCPVLVLAQLNRESEKEDRRPRMSDLRESGAIEQDSDRIWFLWRDPKNIQGGAEDPPIIDITAIQAKCRGGPPNVGKVMEFDRPIYTFKPALISR